MTKGLSPHEAAEVARFGLDAPEPKPYTDEVAPMPHWGDKNITMDALIKAHLAEGQRMHGWQTERMHAAFRYPPGDKSSPAQLTKARMLVSTLGFLQSCIEGSLLMEVQKYLTAEQADEFAAAHVSQGESGDYYPEMLWDWLVERGIDPEKINAQVADEIAANPEPQPAALTEADIIDYFDRHSSDAIRRVLDAGEAIITGRADDGVMS